MPEYLIYFNQQWVGDHPEEWFVSRVEPSMAVVEEMKEAGVCLFAGGLEEEGPVYAADATSGEVVPHRRPLRRDQGVARRLLRGVGGRRRGGQMWAGKVAVGCGWPQEVRRFGSPPTTE